MKMILPRSSIGLTLALAGALALGACATPADSGKPIDDATIASRVKGDLATNDHLSNFHFAVSVVNGVVYLHGMVASVDQKAEAERQTMSVGGVKSVENDITVNTNIQ
jgi:osmotically-inducible protein OsmY